MTNEEERYIGYKINTNNTYKVWCQEYGGYKYYKIQVQKKNFDGTKVNFYKSHVFGKPHKAGIPFFSMSNGILTTFLVPSSGNWKTGLVLDSKPLKLQLKDIE